MKLPSQHRSTDCGSRLGGDRSSLVAVALLLVALPVAAQSRLELFAAIPIPATTVEGTFTSDYVRVDVTLSAGVLFSRFQGYVDQASHFEFRMGGHSPMFYEEALARLRLSGGWHVGYNAGGEVAMPIATRVAVIAGVRVMSAPATRAVVAELLNADQMIFAIPVDRVQTHIGTAPLRFSRRGGPAITLGVRVR